MKAKRVRFTGPMQALRPFSVILTNLTGRERSVFGPPDQYDEPSFDVKLDENDVARLLPTYLQWQELIDAVEV